MNRVIRGGIFLILGVLIVFLFMTFFISKSYPQTAPFIQAKAAVISQGEKDDDGNYGWLKFNTFPQINHDYSRLYWVIYLPFQDGKIVMGKMVKAEDVYLVYDGKGEYYTYSVNEMNGMRTEKKSLSEVEATKIGTDFMEELLKLIEIEDKIWSGIEIKGGFGS